ncbi:pre-toxin TG domain-containing protein [Chengkuizengella sediminis]|uniref:pre-toxin TG domain-containing protein n=1 Tax=Chengkuizengella sediminis TaxID=1885917 RepID=UPI00138A53CB|nr:pre-toxin TG domain-containing protein [Chengkuizengella sediminis]
MLLIRTSFKETLVVSLNKYFINGNPISYIDPFGLSRDSDDVSWYKKATSFGADFIPGIGTAKGFQQAASGYDYITGEKLSTADRWAEGVGTVTSVVPIPGAKHAGKYATKGVIWAGDKAITGVKKLFGWGKSEKIEAPTSLPQPMAGDNIDIQLGKGTGKTNPYDLLDEYDIPSTFDELDRGILDSGNWKMVKKDLKQVRDAAKEVGVDTTEFGNYIHEIKAYEGMKANQNFSYQELLDLAKELKEILK